MAKKKKTTAGAFDVRNIIGALMAIYGVILVIWGCRQLHRGSCRKNRRH